MHGKLNYMKKTYRNQKGMVPVILIVAGVVVMAGILITLWLLTGPNAKKPSPSPVSTISNCKDRDYTGCDGPEVFQWKDDGKR